MLRCPLISTFFPSTPFFFFFFNDTATTEIYTLSLHDALPISWRSGMPSCIWRVGVSNSLGTTVRHSSRDAKPSACQRSEEHTSELQSLAYLVCRLLLENRRAHV